MFKKLWSIKAIATWIAAFEGKKHQASVGDIREIVGLTSDLVYENGMTVVVALWINGFKRAKKVGKA